MHICMGHRSQVKEFLMDKAGKNWYKINNAALGWAQKTK